MANQNKKKAASTLNDMTEEGKDRVEKAGKDLRAGAEKAGKDLNAGAEKAAKDLQAGVKSRAKAGADRSRTEIQKHPLTAVGAAAGAAAAAGIVAGVLL